MSETDNLSTTQLIAALWKRNQPLILERLDQLDAAAAAAHAGSLSEPQRMEAESTAHKLSGSLGMFGFSQGTDFARELETELRTQSPQPQRLTELSIALRATLFPPAP